MKLSRLSGFTMVEIAICLAIIGIALVSIIGVLPIGMNTQRDNREETIINQDATIFMEALRGGARGLDYLTNYVYAISNYYALKDATGNLVSQPPIGFTYTTGPLPLVSGEIIVGLLTSPELIDSNGVAMRNVPVGGYSNHVVAFVRSVSGPAIEKSPQDNDIVREGSFSYRLLCVNAMMAGDISGSTNQFGVLTNDFYQFKYLSEFLHELRLTFLWPQLPNGSVGAGHQTFRTQVAGELAQTTISNQILYFYHSQVFATNGLR